MADVKLPIGITVRSASPTTDKKQNIVDDIGGVDIQLPVGVTVGSASPTISTGNNIIGNYGALDIKLDETITSYSIPKGVHSGDGSVSLTDVAINSLKARASLIKSIKNKGVDVPEDTTIDALTPYINAISHGGGTGTGVIIKDYGNGGVAILGASIKVG